MSDLSECRILIVDDTKANVDVLVETLRDQYKLSVALNGENALRTVERQQPDLILLDIVMPELDGYEVCSRLKADPATADIPVIFISALNESEGKSTGYERGGVDYLTKPFDGEEVKARVRTQLELRRLRRQSAQIGDQLAKLAGELDGEASATLAALADDLRK